MGDHFVYQYLDVNGRTMYIGYGESPSRAMSHTGGSHNPGLRTWLESGVFELRIAGPYRDEAEALAVEAALISAIAPQFNVHPGTGPKFRPLGVPAHLGDRPSLPPLTEEELGRVTGGALLVYIAPLKVMKDERPKVDPTNPEDEVIALDVEAWWEIDRHIASWKSAPELGPQVLVGVYGRPRHRFVIGAFSIDTASWGLSGRQQAGGQVASTPRGSNQSGCCGTTRSSSRGCSIRAGTVGALPVDRRRRCRPLPGHRRVSAATQAQANRGCVQGGDNVRAWGQ